MTMSDPLTRLDCRLTEAFNDLWSNFVDPREPFHDDGSSWISVGSAAGSGSRQACPSEGQLRDLREECRGLAVSNEFAINGHENRLT